MKLVLTRPGGTKTKALYVADVRQAWSVLDSHLYTEPRYTLAVLGDDAALAECIWSRCEDKWFKIDLPRRAPPLYKSSYAI